ncbi:MAG: Panacea domain-containing protein [Gemmobacter sp.]
MYDPRSVANFIVEVRRFLGGQTTQLQLQKLLYFCHASYLVTTRQPLVAGSFEAWEHGPVHPTVYRSFKRFGDAPITERASAINAVTGKIIHLPRPDKQAQRHIVRVVSSLYDLTARQLVDLSHAPNGPWDLVWKQKASKGAMLLDRTIAEHYSKHRLPITLVQDEDAAVILRDLPPYDDRPGEPLWEDHG